MLTVAASGSTNFETMGDTWLFLSQHIMDTGRVADEESVPNAVARACVQPLMKGRGFFPVATKKTPGRIMPPCIKSEMTTHATYFPSAASTLHNDKDGGGTC